MIVLLLACIFRKCLFAKNAGSVTFSSVALQSVICCCVTFNCEFDFCVISGIYATISGITRMI